MTESPHSLTQRTVTSSHCPDVDDDDGRPPLLPRRALVATVACAAGLGCSHFPDGDGRLLLLRWALEAMVGTGFCD